MSTADMYKRAYRQERARWCINCVISRLIARSLARATRQLENQPRDGREPAPTTMWNGPMRTVSYFCGSARYPPPISETATAMRLRLHKQPRSFGESREFAEKRRARLRQFLARRISFSPRISANGRFSRICFRARSKSSSERRKSSKLSVIVCLFDCPLIKYLRISIHFVKMVCIEFYVRLVETRSRCN